ncbi:hypothetical protein [Microbulbifer epialgicus]|uniref:AttH domain-containing protein n=1 Tax=Microbulbifer epialgicus TaxID=393907 RepID=A0ABV4P3J7_9GAMM
MHCLFKTGYLLFSFLLFFLGGGVHATTLDDLRAHDPTSDKTWAEQWFYNIAVPDVGYFKVSLQTYISPDFEVPEPKAYIHLAFSPLDGPIVKHDIFHDEIILDNPDNPGEFYYEVPGLIVADKNHIDINYDFFDFTMRWTGEHHYYWHGNNPGRSPLGILKEIINFGPEWFVYTMGTPIHYSFSDGNIALMGGGFAQLDKGWFDDESSSGIVYTMGLSDELYFMLTGGKVSDTNIEMWIGRYISGAHDMIFYPAFNGLSVRRESDACEGYAKIEFSKINYKLVVEATADPDSFYSQSFPSDVIFGKGQKYMKSMQAKVDFSLYKKGTLIETITMPQALLEFSGPLACETFFDQL